MTFVSFKVNCVAREGPGARGEKCLLGVWRIDTRGQSFRELDRYPLVAAVGAGDQPDLVSPDTTEICQVFQQLLVGFAVDWRGGQAYFPPRLVTVPAVEAGVKAAF